MQIQIEISENNADFFLQYLNKLRDGIIEKIVISEEDKSSSFRVQSKEEVSRRIQSAEERGEYVAHDLFWKEMGVE